MYPEAKFHDETIPLNQDHSNKQDKVLEATKTKEQKKQPLKFPSAKCQVPSATKDP